MQVIIAMAGLGQRFKDKNYSEPKPFVKINSKCVVEYLVDRFPRQWKLVFVVNEYLDEKYIQFLHLRYHDSFVIKTQYSERGPIDTVWSALSSLQQQEPTLVSYCDYSLRWDPNVFETLVVTENVDAAVIGYTGFQPTFLGPNSYCHYLVDGPFVKQLQEKKLYTGQLETEWTSCGLYYFRSASFLKACLEEQLIQNLNYDGKEFYTSLAIQAMMNVHPGLQVLNYPILQFFQMGTPFDIEQILTSSQLLQLGLP